jgi:hypothetical protein
MASIRMLLVSLLVGLLSLVSVHRAHGWEIELYDDAGCGVISHLIAETGSQCISIGGGSWWVSDEAACSFYSWSGDNCRGSNFEMPLGYIDQCWYHPFASIQVAC